MLFLFRSQRPSMCSSALLTLNASPCRFLHYVWIVSGVKITEVARTNAEKAYEPKEVIARLRKADTLLAQRLRPSKGSRNARLARADVGP